MEQSESYFLFLDLEATGLDPTREEIIELSAVRMSLDMQTEIARFDSLIKPQKEVPSMITDLTGISQEMVESAPSQEEVKSRFEGFIQPGDIICGHNISFDTDFLKEKGYTVDHQELDTFPLSVWLMPGVKSHSLEHLTKVCQIQHENAHRAMADVEANRDLMWVLLALMHRELKKCPELKDIAQKAPHHWQHVLTAGEKGDLWESRIPAEEEPKEVMRPDIPAFELGAELLLTGRHERDLIAVEATRRLQEETQEPVALVVPRLRGMETPEGFHRHIPQHQSIGASEVRGYLQSQKELSLSTVILGSKLLSSLASHGPQHREDLPQITHDERKLLEEFLPEREPQRESLSSDLLLTQVSDLSTVSHESIVLSGGSQLASGLNHLYHRELYDREIEKALGALPSSAQTVTDQALFVMGLLKQTIREAAASDAYCEVKCDTSFLSGPAMSNIRADLTKILEAPEIQHTEAYTALMALQGMIEIREENDPTLRYARLSPQDNLVIQQGAADLGGLWSNLMKDRTLLMTLSTDQVRDLEGVLSLGPGLPSYTPEQTSSLDQIPPVQIPKIDGNNKHSDSSLTMKMALEMAQKGGSGKIHLVIFPNQRLRDDALQHEAEGVDVISHYGSAGKMAGIIESREEESLPALLITTASQMRKLPWEVAYEHVWLHRIPFGRPLTALERDQWKGELPDNDFQKIGLPRAASLMRYVLLQSHKANPETQVYLLDSAVTGMAPYGRDFLKMVRENEQPPTRSRWVEDSS